MDAPLTIVFPLYPGLTQLDFTAPYQFLARLPHAKMVAASVGASPIEAEGLTFGGLADLAGLKACDVLCVPGGASCAAAMESPDYMAAIRRLAATARYVTSVCTGSLILGAAGLLRGRRATCHWAWHDLLPAFGAIPENARVVSDGNVITGGGVTAGVDFALTLIAELAGPEVAQEIQLSLEYAPDPPFQAGHPDIAPPELLSRLQQRMAMSQAPRRAVIARVAQAGDWAN